MKWQETEYWAKKTIILISRQEKAILAIVAKYIRF